MTDNSQANKRIARNTLVVYGQLVIRMFLGLYTSRLALEALGVSNFGLYSVVAGVVVLFAFISDSLSNTTIRFVNVERGKPDGNLNRVFNVCHVLHIAMAFFMFILLEVGGVYYIHHYLNVEPARETDAMIVFQVATIVCCIGIINTPFSSMLNAAENFLLTAVVSLSIKVIQLMMLIWLLQYEGNRVVAFALIESLTTLGSFAIFRIYCYSRWPRIVRWRFWGCWQLYKEILIFSYYNLLSTVALMARGQGSLLLINFFYGTVVNGAFAVAKTVERNMSPFASNIQNAAAPQITQSYSSGNMERVFFLASRVTKYCLLMMMIGFYPLWSELDFILHVWLIRVPEGALVFSQLMLLLVFVAVTDGGIWNVVNASGKVSKFRLVYSILIVLCIPIGFLILKSGSPAYMILVVFLIADFLWRILQLFLVYKILNFPVLNYCLETYLPVIIASLPIILCLFLSSQIKFDSILWNIGHLITILLVSIISTYFLGLKKSEREKVTQKIVTHIRLFRNEQTVS